MNLREALQIENAEDRGHLVPCFLRAHFATLPSFAVRLTLGCQ